MAFTAVFALTVLGGIISEYVLKRHRDSEIAAATTIQRHARGMISRKRPIRAAEDMHCFLCSLIVASLFASLFAFCFPSSTYTVVVFIMQVLVLTFVVLIMFCAILFWANPRELTPSELAFLVLVCLNIQRW